MFDLSSIRKLGADLKRPECALAHQSGLLLAPCWHGAGGVSVVRPDGSTQHVICRTEMDSSLLEPHGLRPNGIALEPGGTVLLAHLGDALGGVFRLHPSGDVEPAILRANDAPLPPTNFVVHDRLGRLWITVSTRCLPRADDYRAGADSGFIAVALPGEDHAHIVADGLGYANECVIDEDRGQVYVNETFARRLTRFTLGCSGSADSVPTLRNKTVIHKFGAGTYPDGMALASDGSLWITSIVSNRVLTVSPDGIARVVLEDSNADHLDWTEAAWQSDSMGRPHLDQARGKRLRNISNLAFGGPTLSTAYLGNLQDDGLYAFDAGVGGVAMPHWDVPLGALGA